MLAQHTPLLFTPTDTEALSTAMVEPEAILSDAPIYSPRAEGTLLALILLSPKQPKEPKGK
ncbi:MULTISPECIES: hypothetical protein [Streptomyces]|uniref:Uncharacterized protein n=1 Tax=Streptomyces venezuelae TaxID=54571 RepID=A0A5P2BRN9_STRVZ|nr:MULTISPECIES: hypothetical protein [Streptomyces]NEA06385.1 hypothetical protein [Streptomyces sp. SID10116]MYY79889.1 hypothetical protein [Streptomyces sp. SID335]MYZ14939.1 hypothetical protein [Streptomyces sp. SID337]NDZ87493.1 hypothetical protein [Streptomyces sp. SID10115]NEB43340.1 hypothetical protein [Streptomyces sp. SID339]